MKRLAIMLPALFFLALATDAQAGARIVTPHLTPPQDGRLRCGVVNASDKKEVTVEITIYDFDGGVVSGPNLQTLSPNWSFPVFATDDAATHCVVRVLKGGKKNVRVSLSILDIDSDVTAAVAGY